MRYHFEQKIQHKEAHRLMNKEKKTIGLYFGSFNPPHVGHMIIANYLLSYSKMDELWFVVSPHNPLMPFY